MFDISPVHLLIFLAIALIVLGPKRLPELGRSLGRGMREFRGSITGDHDDAPAPEAGSVLDPQVAPDDREPARLP